MLKASVEIEAFILPFRLNKIYEHEQLSVHKEEDKTVKFLQFEKC